MIVGTIINYHDRLTRALVPFRKLKKKNYLISPLFDTKINPETQHPLLV